MTPQSANRRPALYREPKVIEEKEWDKWLKKNYIKAVKKEPKPQEQKQADKGDGVIDSRESPQPPALADP